MPGWVALSGSTFLSLSFFLLQMATEKYLLWQRLQLCAEGHFPSPQCKTWLQFQIPLEAAVVMKLSSGQQNGSTGTFATSVYLIQALYCQAEMARSGVVSKMVFERWQSCSQPGALNEWLCGTESPTDFQPSAGTVTSQRTKPLTFRSYMLWQLVCRRLTAHLLPTL